MRNLIVFGPPGSGKGTQSENIVRRYGLSHLSTGVMLRNEIAKSTDLGIMVESIMREGELVPDAIVMEMTERFINNHNDERGVVYDGFPRTTPQAEQLDGLLARDGMAVDLVIFIDVSEEEIFSRILGRSVDSQRADDTVEVIKRRIRIYREVTFPVIRYYHIKKKFACVNGMAPVDEVFGRICQIISDRIPDLKPVTI